MATRSSSSQTDWLAESRLLQLQAHNNALKVLVSERSKALHRIHCEISQARGERERLEQSHEAISTLRASLKRFEFEDFFLFFSFLFLASLLPSCLH